LFGALELREYLDGLRDVDPTGFFAMWRIAQFAESRVSGTSIIPAIRTLLGHFGGDLIYLNAKGWFDAPENCPQIRRHDPGANQDDIEVGA
jgi:hypothetical protein